ncbi:MAG: hypothetical protein Q9190_001175 [Brigantiaea leucoxantha]
MASLNDPPFANPETSWSTASTAYTDSVGRVSAQVCQRLLALANEAQPLSSQSSNILDHGAGTGSLTTAVTTAFPAIRVLATDISPGMLSAIEAKQIQNVVTSVVDATKIGGLGHQKFSHVFSTFMIQFVLQPINVLQEMHRVLQSGGVLGLAIWGEEIAPNDIWEQTCQSLDPAYQMPNPYRDPNRWRTAEEVKAAVEEIGFREVDVKVLKPAYQFEDEESYIKFYFEGKNPVAERFIASFEWDLGEVKEAMRTVLREKYDHGRKVPADAVLAVARK